MAGLFTTILNMSLTASIIILIVLLVRLCLKKAPKIYSYLLWAVVLFRLLCPVSFSLPVSVLAPISEASTTAGTSYTASMEYISVPQRPEPQHTQPPVQNELPVQDEGNDTPIIPEQNAPAVVVEQQAKRSAGEIALTILGWVWAAGMVGVLGFTTWQTLMLKRKLDTAFIIRGNIFESEQIDTAFILGVFNPKIYLPLDLPFDIQKAVVAHEQTHQRRGDHVVKLVSYFTLAIHWFNPLVWLSFKLMCDDMEKSCDEAVLREMNNRGYSMKSIKKAYGNMLLVLGGGKQHIFSPVSFAENSTKSRVKNVVAYSRTARNMGVGLAVVCVLVALLCVVNPTGAAAAAVSDTDAAMTASDSDTLEPVMLTIGDVEFPEDVTELDLSAQGKIDISALRSCKNLRSLNLSFSIVNDLSPLLECKELREVYLCDDRLYEDDNYSVWYGPYISADNMRVLAQLPELERLSLWSIRNESIDVLADFKALKYFSVYHECVRNDDLTPQYTDMREMYGQEYVGRYSVVEKAPRTIEKFGMRFEFLEGLLPLALREYSNLKFLDFVISDYQDTRLPNPYEFFSEMSGLQELYISVSSENTDLGFIGNLPELELLDISGYGAYTNTSEISKCRKLKSLSIDDIDDVSFVYDLENLTKLGIRGWSGDFDIAELKSKENLRSLSMYSGKIKSIDALRYCSNIINLRFAVWDDERGEIKEKGAEYFSFIDELDNLETFEILTYEQAYDNAKFNMNLLSDAKNLKDISLQIGSVYNVDGIANAHGLQRIFLNEVSEDGEFGFLRNMKEMRSINIICPEGMTDISFIAGMQSLETIWLAGNFSDVSAIGALEHVQDLELESPVLSNITPLGAGELLNNVKSLYINSSMVSDASILADSSLISLHIENSPVKDISFVSSMPNLEWIWLCHTKVTDISPLYDVPKLDYLRIYDGETDFTSQINALLELKPNCEVEAERGVG